MDQNLIFLPVFLALAGQACSWRGGPTIPQQPVKASDSNSYITDHGAGRKAAIWKQAFVPVCWEADTRADLFSKERLWVRQAVEETWEKHSTIDFTGWQACLPKNRGVRILNKDLRPHTKGLGQELDGVRDGMVINFYLTTWSCPETFGRELCIKAMAIHEFGHSAGLTHEPGPPCRALWEGPHPDVILTAYDPRSIMNYCSVDFLNFGKLSMLDKESISKLYP